LLDRYHVKPENALFIDDSLRNIKAAEELGINAIHFKSPELLRKELEARGIL
jgi:2-haloacid dehalogenase